MKIITSTVGRVGRGLGGFSSENRSGDLVRKVHFVSKGICCYLGNHYMLVLSFHPEPKSSGNFSEGPRGVELKSTFLFVQIVVRCFKHEAVSTPTVPKTREPSGMHDDIGNKHGMGCRCRTCTVMFGESMLHAVSCIWSKPLHDFSTGPLRSTSKKIRLGFFGFFRN